MQRHTGPPRINLQFPHPCMIFHNETRPVLTRPYNMRQCFCLQLATPLVGVVLHLKNCGVSCSFKPIFVNYLDDLYGSKYCRHNIVVRQLSSNLFPILLHLNLQHYLSFCSLVNLFQFVCLS